MDVGEYLLDLVEPIRGRGQELRRLRVIQDRSQRLVDLVGDGGGQLADDGQTRGVREVSRAGAGSRARRGAVSGSAAEGADQAGLQAHDQERADRRTRDTVRHSDAVGRGRACRPGARSRRGRAFVSCRQSTMVSKGRRGLYRDRSAFRHSRPEGPARPRGGPGFRSSRWSRRRSRVRGGSRRCRRRARARLGEAARRRSPAPKV